MPDMLGNMQTWLEDKRKSHLSTERKLDYVKKSQPTGRVDDMQGVSIGNRSEAIDSSANVAYVQVETRDYIIPRDILTLDGGTSFFEPEAGDTIEEHDAAGVIYTFEAMAYGGTPAVEWHNPERTAYRVHCNQIALA